MLPRLLLILTILVHQLALPGVVVASGPEPCAEPTCCAVVEVTTCCGTRVESAPCTCGDDCACRGSTAPDAPVPAPVVTPAAPKLVLTRDAGAIVDRLVAATDVASVTAPRRLAPVVIRAGRQRLVLDSVLRL